MAFGRYIANAKSKVKSCTGYKPVLQRLPSCNEISMAVEPKTLHAWKQAHPHVNVLAFERNHDKIFGFGDLEEVCGFCLASLYFDEEPPESCPFCRAPIREAPIISDSAADPKREIYLGLSGGFKTSRNPVGLCACIGTPPNRVGRMRFEKPSKNWAELVTSAISMKN